MTADQLYRIDYRTGDSRAARQLTAFSHTPPVVVSGREVGIGPGRWLRFTDANGTRCFVKLARVIGYETP